VEALWDPIHRRSPRQRASDGQAPIADESAPTQRFARCTIGCENRVNFLAKGEDFAGFLSQGKNRLMTVS
jgi:hypothetical protein